MVFRSSQFGRFGTEVGTLVGFTATPASTPSAIDSYSASLLGNDTPAHGKAENSAHWLRQRGYPERSGEEYLTWRDSVFPRLVREKHPAIIPLASSHLNCKPICIHDCLPSTLHKPLLGWFNPYAVVAFDYDGVSSLTNITTDQTGTLIPDKWTPNGTVPFYSNDSGVTIIWVLDQAGEILVTPEQLFVKHSSVAAGCSVWAAGEMGFEHGKLRVVNLRSGHYMSKDNLQILANLQIVDYKISMRSVG